MTVEDKKFQACLREEYGINAVTLEKIHAGLDSNAAVYRVTDERGQPYLLKARFAGPFYEPGCLVPRTLQEKGISSVISPMPTKIKTLWADVGDGKVILYPFIKGDTSWTGMTDSQWQELGSILKQIHSLSPPLIKSLRRETFDPSGYVQEACDLRSALAHTPHESETARHVHSAWKADQAVIDEAVASLQTLGAELQNRNLPQVLCHADVHPGNVLRADDTGQPFLIDWDEVMLTPKERDFIFVRGPQTQAFFKGYGGDDDVDPMALAYFLWERVVQDIISFSRDICFKTGWSEETRADNFKILKRILAGGDGTIPSARAAQTRIPLHQSS